MPGSRLTAVVFAAAIAVASPVWADGLLGRVRGEVNEPSHGSSGTGESSDDSDSCDDDDDDGFFAGLAAWVVIKVVTAPFTLPIAIVGDEYEQTANFSDAPYSLSDDSYLQFPTEPDDTERDWAGRFSLETGGDFDGLAAVGGRLQLEHRNRFGIDASWTSLREYSGGRRDSLTLGDANVVFRFAQSESTQFYSGIGLNWMADHGDGDAGFNFTYGGDWFPMRPLVVSSTIDWGTLGGATLFRSRTTVGAMIDRFEIYSGFDYLNVEGVDIPTGIAGLRIWY
jgi:hypothetical protein